MTTSQKQSELYYTASKLCQELHKEVLEYKTRGGKPTVSGEIKHFRSNALKVHIPRASALRLLVAEIALKKGLLLDVKKAIK